MNLLEFQKKFSDEQACRDWLAEERWGKQSATCVHCGCKETYKYEDGRLFKCKKCKKQFTVRIGTIFEDSRIPLIKWFIAIYLFSSMKKGISSIQLSKYVEVTQKTAWFMLHRIREVMKGGNDPFNGITEIDEAYIGGSDTNKHKDKKGISQKTTVIGIVNRDTKQVKAFKVIDNKAEHLLPRINVNVERGSTIITDTYFGYDRLRKNYNHETIKHSAEEYVRNDARTAFKIHTNTIEGFWSHLKRGITGIYHWASEKHMQKYCNEFSFRYNVKELNDFGKFASWFCGCEGKRVVYRVLVG